MVVKDAAPRAGAAKVQTLQGNDYVRVWVNKGGNHYLIHLPTGATCGELRIAIRTPNSQGDVTNNWMKVVPDQLPVLCTQQLRPSGFGLPVSVAITSNCS